MWIYILFALMGVASLSAQEKRAIFASESVEAVRPVGEFRTWSFFAKKTTFGRLTSVIKGKTHIDGREALIVEERLNIDYSLIGGDSKVDVSGEQYISLDGYYLGTNVRIGGEGEAETLEMKRADDRAEGYYTRGDQKINQTIEFQNDLPAWEAYFVDQLEILLAMRDIQVGDTIVDSIYCPHSMIKSRIAGEVVYWMWQEIYKGEIDSVFIIRLHEPQDYQLYFTADKKLVRVDMESQNIRVYQDMVRPPLKSQTDQVASQVAKPRLTARRLLFKSPHYVAYLVIGLLSAVFITRSAFKWLDSYLAVVMGIIAYFPVLITQIPLQKVIITNWVIPKISAGGSIFFWGVIPGMIAGVIQTLLVIGTLYLLFIWRKPKEYRYAWLGVFAGLGFGLAEACHLSGLTIIPLFTWSLLERGCLILFHTMAGALLGRAISRGWDDKLSVTVAVLVLFNASFRYLPVFVQGRVADVEVMYLVMAFIALGFLLYALLSLKSSGEPQ